ncbi:hypothetical protein TRL7639_04483 [Falsiruegeria litorea R37]|uniref:Transposase IS30-like HTH domain-containing protein n=1 Tax=Falsiruegeria litorea R37 TaxID=1200284 RepID=A0A1Y5TWK9_9RHOB|nr:hypothetical protein TRL7639_04483 [Falsiruegeria litorea R37]
MGHHYSHLRLDERRKIAKWLKVHMPISEIADRLCRDASTIYRDTKRNRYTDSELPELDGYHAVAAQDMYEKRRAIHRKMMVFPELKAGSPARRCTPVDHLRPRNGIFGLATAQRRDWSRQLVLRSTGALAERHRREHQQQAAKVPAPLDRTDGADQSIFKVDLPPPQFHAAQMPLIPDACRSVRKPPDRNSEPIGIKRDIRNCTSP